PSPPITLSRIPHPTDSAQPDSGSHGTGQCRARRATRTKPTDVQPRTESPSRAASLVLVSAATRARVVATRDAGRSIILVAATPAVRGRPGRTSLFPLLDVTQGRVPEFVPLVGGFAELRTYR